jgi:hypothetical protein
VAARPERRSGQPGIARMSRWCRSRRSGCHVRLPVRGASRGIRRRATGATRTRTYNSPTYA